MNYRLKGLLFGKETEARRIKYGIARNIRLKIDPLNKSQRLLGLDEKEIHHYFKKFAVSSKIFVDVGSSDGYYALIFRRWNPNGEIYSCEMQSAFFAEQESNFRLNNFSIDANFNRVSKLIGASDSADCVRLDSLFKDQKQLSVFLKIDVDGGEFDVLKGAQNLLIENFCKIIVETHSKKLETECVQYMQNLGYHTRIIDNAWWRFAIPEKREIPHNRWMLAYRQS